MLDPIADSWEARISSVRMSSKNLVGDNAKKYKKVWKIDVQMGGNLTPCSQENLVVQKQKRENSPESFAFKILDLIIQCPRLSQMEVFDRPNSCFNPLLWNPIPTRTHMHGLVTDAR